MDWFHFLGMDATKDCAQSSSVASPNPKHGAIRAFQIFPLASENCFD
jgi:hypothetical protein